MKKTTTACVRDKHCTLRIGHLGPCKKRGT